MFQSKEVLELCEVLAQTENLKVTVREATKGSLIIGCSAFTGAMLGGPVGLAVGGTAASIITAWRSRYSYRSVVDIIKNDLTPEQKSKLINAVHKQLLSIEPEHYAQLLKLVLSSAPMKEAVIAQIGCFLMNEMKLQMIR